MTGKNTISPFFTYVFCIVVYFFAIFTNELFIQAYLYEVDPTFTERDGIIFFKICGYISATVILLFFVRVFDFKKMISCSIFLYWLSVFNIIFVDVSHEITLIYFLIYSASTIIVSVLILGYILCDNRIRDNYSISIYFFAILSAYIIVEIFEYFMLSNGNNFFATKLMVLNVIPIGGFMLVLIMSPIFRQKINLDEYRFFAVIARMEIEILVGFTVFYVVMVVLDGYEVYALVDLLTIFEDITRKYIRLCSAVVALALTTIYIPRLNKHKININSIILLILVFASMPYWGKYSLSTIVGRAILITSLYTLLACSVLLLAEKFKGINLFGSLSIYALGCTLGYYCGYITINTSENTLGVNGFLISICFVLLGLLFYYSYLFKKYKLYR